MSDVRNPQQFPKKLYHGTSQGRAEKIRVEGLRSGQGPHEVHSVSASEDPQEAWGYAHRPVEEHDPVVLRNNRPVLIEFDEPDDIPFEAHGSGRWFRNVTIPPERLTIHDRIGAQTIIDEHKRKQR